MSQNLSDGAAFLSVRVPIWSLNHLKIGSQYGPYFKVARSLQCLETAQPNLEHFNILHKRCLAKLDHVRVNIALLQVNFSQQKNCESLEITFYPLLDRQQGWAGLSALSRRNSPTLRSESLLALTILNPLELIHESRLPSFKCETLLFQIGSLSRDLVAKWKDIVTREEEREDTEEGGKEEGGGGREVKVYSRKDLYPL